MKRWMKQCFFLVYLITVSAQVEAAPIAQLKEFLASSKTVSADFKQEVVRDGGNILQVSKGQFYLQKPGRFRWNYIKPFAQEIVANAGRVWFYDQDLDQVTIKKLNTSVGSTPALLLTGAINLEDNFTLEEQGKTGLVQWVKLLPKNEQDGFQHILIGISKGILTGMELSDNFGQLTRIYFSNVAVNQPLSSTLFEFTIPDGADVFEE